MTNKKIWFITGASRGMGVDFVKAALAAGHAVVGTGRDPDAVAKAVGDLDDLQVVRLDVTSPADAEAAVRAAVDRFGRTELLTKESMAFADRPIEDYAGRRAEQLKWWEAQNGRQPGDPAKLARAVVRVAGEQSPPRRFIAGTDAIALAEQKVADLKA